MFMDSAQIATSTYLALFGMVSGFALMIIVTDDAGAQTVCNFTITERSFPLSYQGTEAGGVWPWAVLVHSPRRFGTCPHAGWNVDP